jgi:RNA polymerase sigma-B factor
MSKQDLVKVATVGLINAVDRFDVRCGSDFLSFTVPTMMGEVRRHLRDTGWVVRMPTRLTELHLSISRAVSELARRHGAAPAPSEIAAHPEIGQGEVLEGLQAGYACHSTSLGQPLSSDTTDFALEDTLGSRTRNCPEWTTARHCCH